MTASDDAQALLHRAYDVLGMIARYGDWNAEYHSDAVALYDAVGDHLYPPDAGHVDTAEVGGGKVGHRHPSTSRRAAATVRRGTQQSALLALVVAAGEQGVTCYEATEPLRMMLGRGDLARNQVATRMGELAERGLVTRLRLGVGAALAGHDSEFVERQTEGDNRAAVWFATEAGRQERARIQGAST